MDDAAPVVIVAQVLGGARVAGTAKARSSAESRAAARAAGAVAPLGGTEAREDVADGAAETEGWWAAASFATRLATLSLLARNWALRAAAAEDEAWEEREADDAKLVAQRFAAADRGTAGMCCVVTAVSQAQHSAGQANCS